MKKKANKKVVKKPNYDMVIDLLQQAQAELSEFDTDTAENAHFDITSAIDTLRYEY